MNAALLKVSLDVIANHFFDGKVKVRAAILEADDTRNGTITLLIEGDDLPPAPPEGHKYPKVNAIMTSVLDRADLVPRETLSVRFEVIP